MRAKLLAGGILVFLVILFTLQNTEVVTIRFLFWTFAMSRVILLFLIFVLGAVAGWLAGSLTRARRR